MDHEIENNSEVNFGISVPRDISAGRGDRIGGGMDCGIVGRYKWRVGFVDIDDLL